MIDVTTALGTEAEIAGHVAHVEVAGTQRIGAHATAHTAQRHIARADAADPGVTLDALGLEITGANRAQVKAADVGGIDVARTHARPEARRGGKEWVSTCRSRWSPSH